MHALRNTIPRCAGRTRHLATPCGRLTTVTPGLARWNSSTVNQPSASSSSTNDTSNSASKGTSQQEKSPAAAVAETLTARIVHESVPKPPIAIRRVAEKREKQREEKRKEDKKKEERRREERRKDKKRTRKVIVKPTVKVNDAGESAVQGKNLDGVLTEKLEHYARSHTSENPWLMSEDRVADATYGPDFYKENTPFHDNPAGEEDRQPPPHILKQEIIRSGVIQSPETTLADVEPMEEQKPVDRLSHDLDRVLFNPGVHWLQDPRSRLYNFTPWLQKIPRVNDFAFDRLSGFVKSSRDEELRKLAKREGKKFAGSTSSLSGMLCHIYFLLSEFKEVDCSNLSQHFKNQPSTFTAGQKIPATVLLNYKDGVYAIDSHSAVYDEPDKNVLTWLGTLLENFLTKNPADFKKFMHYGTPPEATNEKRMKEAFRYSKSRDFVMRSQLDCQDHRLPGTGVFDIKTRACVTVRMDILNWEENAGYMITNQSGLWESFEKEYYDLIRSGFLKYGFQARIGNMDGVMVTYHNTEKIFGFQYIPLAEMDERLFGNVPGIGEKVFSHCVWLLEEILRDAAKCFPEQSVLCTFETRAPGRVLEIYVQPAEWTGPEEERPMQKFVVTLDHLSGGQPVRPITAMKQPDLWKVNYQIGRPSLSLENVKRDYAGLQARKKRLLVLPSYVTTMQEAEEFWKNLQFSSARTEPTPAPELSASESQAGDAASADEASSTTASSEVAKPESAFQSDSFTLVTSYVEKYREMARRGREIEEALDTEERGKPKFVLGMEGVWEEDKEWDEFLENSRKVTPPLPKNTGQSSLENVEGGEQMGVVDALLSAQWDDGPAFDPTLRGDGVWNAEVLQASLGRGKPKATRDEAVPESEPKSSSPSSAEKETSSQSVAEDDTPESTQKPL